MENYGVKYNIQVIADPAIEAIAKFARVTDNLNIASTKFKNLQNTVESLNASLNKFKTQKAPVVQINTRKAQDNINKLIGRIDQLKIKLNQLGLTSVAAARSWAATPPMMAATNGAWSPMPVVNTKQPKQKPTKPVPQPKLPRRNIGPNRSALSYRALGPAMIDSGGIGAISLMKGMGIAYGISAIGSLASNVVKDASEYDNLMQSTRNILEAHDKQGGFGRRFSEMEKIVRQVGVETKFTAPQVADAAKFLAMAGFDLDAINKSIRPIADIALVGDTDLGETADVVTNIMTGYNIAPEKVRKAADVMTMTFTKSNTTLMELAEAYKYAASLLSAGGISFEESTAGLGVLGDAGIKGSQAGTTMRTIMANIVNPTKKQAAEWERIGVKRLDENGNARDLVDIFGDLASKNLNVSSFYKMFHKTAAMGAVALANHVDKWNEIVELNFMSEGMVGDLAEKKKNTIQGLWAQLTSMFTEGGMRAFEAMKPEIKEMLSNGVGFFRSEETIERIKSTAQALLDLVKAIIKITGVFYNFWEKYQGFIMFWLKLQLVLSAVLVPLRAMKGLMNFGRYAISSIGAVGMMTRQVGAFTGAVRQATFAKSAFNQTVMTGGAYGVPAGSYGLITRAPSLANWFNVPASKYTKTVEDVLKNRARRGVTASSVDASAVASRYNQIYAKQVEANRRANWANFRMQGAQMATGAGTMLSGAAGSYLGSQLSGGSMWGTLLGGTLGMAAGLAGPWSLLIGGAAAFAGYLIDANRTADQLIKNAQDLNSEYRVQNGLLTGDGVSTLTKSLTLAYKKEQELTNEVERRLGLRQDENNVAAGSKNVDFKGERAEENLKAYRELSRAAKMGLLGDKISPLLNPMINGQPGEILQQEFDFDTLKFRIPLEEWMSKKLVKVGSKQYFWRLTDGGGEEEMTPEQAVVADALHQEGLVTADRLINEYYNKIEETLSKGKIEDLNDIFQDIDQETNLFNATGPGLSKWGLEDYDSASNAQKNSNYYYREAIYRVLGKYLGADSQLRNAVTEFTHEKDNGTLTAHTVLKTVSALNPALDDYITGYLTGGVNGLLESLGYKDGGFIDFKHGKTVPTLEYAQEVQRIINQINQYIDSLGTYAVSRASGLINNLNLVGNLAGGMAGAWDDKGVLEDNLPSIATIKGITYQKAPDGDYYPTGNVAKIIPQLSPLQFQTLWKESALQIDPDDPDGKTPPPLGGSTGSDQSKYKTHYGNGSAAPRQIIIKIDKMLGIEKIDMANKDKAEIVALIEEYATQGLINAFSNATAAINANPTT